MDLAINDRDFTKNYMVQYKKVIRYKTLNG